MGNDNTGGGGNFAKQAEDKSLYGLGKLLEQLAPPFHDQAADLRRMAEQVDADQPASQTVKDHLHEMARKAAELAALADEGPALHGQHHEADNERTENGRGGRAAEKRADVSWSERDGF